VATELRKAALLAAGRGTRLGALTANTPKPLLEVAGAPLISHIVAGLADAGIAEFVIVTGYLGEQVEKWAADFGRAHPQLRIATVRQRELNGTGGAMLAARPHLESEARFLFGWGDVLMDRANYARFLERARAEQFDLMLTVNRVRDPYRGAAVYLTPDMRVERLVEKPPKGTSTTTWNNAGLFASGPILFEYLERLRPSPRGEIELPGAIEGMIVDGRIVRAFASRGFWTDVGAPEDLDKARHRFRPELRQS
jgi:UDP-N-acetylglucosamine diphosphorylase / glucose-1-phosphate thymidylyltransferase / UDP-N-acetylgalactosamine diphosphorylase / glucosamine-1-phosphate N-acetyltransferase / galactosamine-1-phosphate N-acetyltransferase